MAVKKKSRLIDTPKVGRKDREMDASAANDRDEPREGGSWAPGDKGQGREGRSKGLGGSRGSGTGPSGPEEK